MQRLLVFATFLPSSFLLLLAVRVGRDKGFGWGVFFLSVCLCSAFRCVHVSACVGHEGKDVQLGFFGRKEIWVVVFWDEACGVFRPAVERADGWVRRDDEEDG